MLEDQLAEALRAEADKFNLSLRPPGALLRRAKRRVSVGIGVIALSGLLLVGVLGAGLIRAVDVMRAEHDDGVRLVPSSVANHPLCSNDSPHGLSMRFTSPPFLIDSGRWQGQDWYFCVQTAARTDQVDAGEARGGFCTEFGMGKGSRSGMDCFFSDQPLSPDYQQITVGTDTFFGAVPDDAATVEVPSSDREREWAQIYEPPPGLGLPFKLVVAFGDPTCRPSLVVGDASGKVVARWPSSPDAADGMADAFKEEGLC